MKCPKCEYENPVGHKFCGECGNSLIEASDKADASVSIESERKHVTIMFSDLSGYTAMTERLDPEEVKEIMSLIFAKITRIIKMYDGFIERFIGDAVMAVFGIPKAHEDDPVRAVRAAMEIHAAVATLSPQFEGKIGRPLTMHTGINTGLVVSGEVDVEKGIHGLTGDAINLASRLEGIAKAGEIIVGPDTYYQATNYFEFETLEPAKVKGKSEPVSVYKVVSVLDQQAVTQRMHGVQAELIGREAEMALLIEAVENLKQGKGSIISIVGHAGTGKSRLTREFRARLEPDEVQWHEGHAYAYTQNVAYYPLTNLLTHAFQIREGDDPDQIREKVEGGVEALLWDKPEAKKYLGGLFALSYTEIDEVSPEFWQAQLHLSVQQILEALASRGPTVVLFEDLHWADSSFIELLHILLKNTHRPVLFLCAYRPSFSLFQERKPDSLAWPHQEIELRELPWDEEEAMLQSLLHASELPDELRYFIKQKVEGNPFYLEEVINTLIETGTLISDNGGWLVNKTLDLADIPTSIQGVLTARLDRLEKEAKRILQEASVIGRSFFYKVLTRITELPTPLDGYLSGLESLDLIRSRHREPELEYIFKHALTQEVVYNGLLKKDRRDIHERIGVAMEKLFGERMPEFYETLAFHFSRGRSMEKAVNYLVKSGRKNLDRYAVEESHQYFTKAYGFLSSKKKLSDAEKNILIDMLNSWGYCFYYLGEMKEFIDIFNSHQALADSLKDKARTGMFYAWFGTALFMAGKSKNAYDYLLKGLELGEKADNQKVLGYACTWLTWACGELGLFAEGIDYGDRAQKIAELFPSDQYLFFKSLAGICFINFYKGNTHRVFECAERLLEYGDRNVNSRSKMLGHWMKAFGHWDTGDMKASRKSSETAIEVALDPFYAQFSKLTLGIAFFSEDKHQEAENAFQSTLKFCVKRGEGQLSVISQAFLAPILVARGQMKPGIKLMEDVQNTLIKNQRRVQYALSEYILGEVYLQIATGPKPSLAIMAKNIGFLVKNVPFATKTAEKHFSKAIELFEEIGARSYLGQAHLSLGLLYKAKKKTTEARQNILEAIDLFKECGAEAHLKRAGEALESLQ